MQMPIDPVMDELGLPVGYGLHSGYVLKCAGQEGTDANGAPTLEQHVIATLVMDPNAKDALGNPIDIIRVGNKSHDGIFELDPSQTNFPTTLKCRCGAGVKL